MPLLPVPAPVSPGDLITADLVRQMLAKLQEIEVRVSDLENSGPPGNTVVITSIVPDGGVASVNGRVQINGRNFGPRGAYALKFGNAFATADLGSNDTLILTTIPPLTDPLPGLVTVYISTTTGGASAQLYVTPSTNVRPEGRLSPRLASPPAATNLVPGNSYDFGYEIQANSNVVDDYLVTAVIDPGWTAVVTLPTANPSGQNILRIPVSPPPAGSTRTATIRVTIPSGPGAPTSAKLQLKVQSVNFASIPAGFSAESDVVANASPPAVQSIPVQLTPPVAGVQGAATPTLNTANNTLTVTTPSGKYRLDFNAFIDDPAYVAPNATTGTPGSTYDVTLVSPGTGWVVSFALNSVVATLQLAPGQNPSNNPIRIFVTAPASAATGTLTVHVQKSGNAAFFGDGSLTLTL